MLTDFQINPQLNIPIYQQLVDAIAMAVKKGQLAPGQQLPTVQELSEQLNVARGTAKRAYDELEHLGLVEKAQGRGTFVSDRPKTSGSRKDQAMAAIDKLLEELQRQGFSPAQIGIFLDLKLRQLEEKTTSIKVAILECNQENLTYLTEQLRTIPQVDIYSYLVENLEQYPYQLEEDLDLAVTTANHGAFLRSILPGDVRVARVALRLTNQCLSSIIKLHRGQRVGTLCYSSRFGQLLYTTAQSYTEGVELCAPTEFAAIADMQAYLNRMDAVLLPRDYEKYCTAPAAQALRDYDGQKILCSYEMDEGSFLYLQEKSRQILEQKKTDG